MKHSLRDNWDNTSKQFIAFQVLKRQQHMSMNALISKPVGEKAGRRHDKCRELFL